MSASARGVRSPRQQWARPGGRHDRLIRTSNWLIPASIGVLTAFLVMAPLTMAGDVSFVLDKNKVEVAKERMKLQSATYRGTDAKGQPFELDAGSAVQKSSAEAVVRIQQMAAAIQLQDGPARLTAPTARYDMDAEKVRVDGPIAVRAPNNYSLDTSSADVDLKTRQLTSTAPVTGTVRQGNFSANSMSADLESRTVRLNGNARLRIVPRQTK
ncbi:LPS export ABC transporter periplasmic protein LptC [Sphingomonas sp. HHU CXW]|jgi:lipopolysaccharide export system protein LptC|uniref:LPS export ABC transporter periplasmic protein LptC n=1 Tax=Sphingomonas hominis TaxID=2741495 RepID=A0ABX2JKF4_9SPHN|nr:LPS export ABC transporter periplasmic protein LptC [Sphingomonas hominis]NTS66136.1 LPS export ABC transporter periplasmic protein LptC [Sphingomonas hominis]